MLNIIGIILFSYFLGAIPFSYLFPKLFRKVDVRENGTRNVGASNAIMSGGAVPGVLALIGDMAKGFLAVLLARYFFQDTAVIAFSGAAAIVGHDFSVFLKFRGGKGIATTGGVIFGIDPIFVVIMLLLYALLVFVLRYFIVSTLIILFLVPVFMWVVSFRLEYIYLGIFCALLAFYQHRQDIVRFVSGQEKKIDEQLGKK